MMWQKTVESISGIFLLGRVKNSYNNWNMSNCCFQHFVFLLLFKSENKNLKPWTMKVNEKTKTYVAFPSRRKMQERENCRVADTTFFDRGLNLSLTSVCVGMGLAYCFMFILLVAKAFLLPDGDSWRRERNDAYPGE